MLRYGITTLPGLISHATKGPVRSAIDCSLYQAVLQADLEAKVVQDLQSEILRRLRFPNGTYKRTHAARFERFDELVVQQAGNLQEASVLRVLDMGVSDATTSVDLWERLNADTDRTVEYLATDKYVEIELRWHRERPLQFALDSSGEVIQVRHGNFVLNCFRPESWCRFPFNRWLLEWKVPRLIARYKAGEGDSFVRERIRLVGQRPSEVEARGTGFSVGECDLFEPPSDTYHMVRAMNVLNPGYFSEERLQAALIGLLGVLVPGGLLVVGANEEAGSEVEGGIYRRHEGHFEPVVEADHPCRIDTLIRSTRTSDATGKD